MERQNEKCVMVIDGSMPLGMAANTAAILGITMGKELPEMVGPDVRDQAGGRHPGIIAFPLPVLRGDAEMIRGIWERLKEPEFAGITAVDFTTLAQGCKSYERFIAGMGKTLPEELTYLGVALCGDKKQINRLTGSMPLLR